MIETKKELNYYLKEDWSSNSKKTYSLWVYWKGLLFNRDYALAYQYLKSLRYYEFELNKKAKCNLLNRAHKTYLKWRFKILCRKYDINVIPNTIGYGLYLPHVVGGGIILNCKSIGNYCKINCGVVVGRGKQWDDVPVIGNHCEINTGSVIYGKIIVGDCVKIAPNSVLFTDVPNKVAVAGNPAKVIKYYE